MTPIRHHYKGQSNIKEISKKYFNCQTTVSQLSREEIVLITHSSPFTHRQTQTLTVEKSICKKPTTHTQEKTVTQIQIIHK